MKKEVHKYEINGVYMEYDRALTDAELRFLFLTKGPWRWFPSTALKSWLGPYDHVGGAGFREEILTIDEHGKVSPSTIRGPIRDPNGTY